MQERLETPCCTSPAIPRAGQPFVRPKIAHLSPKKHQKRIKKAWNAQEEKLNRLLTPPVAWCVVQRLAEEPVGRRALRRAGGLHNMPYNTN